MSAGTPTTGSTAESRPELLCKHFNPCSCHSFKKVRLSIGGSRAHGEFQGAIKVGIASVLHKPVHSRLHPAVMGAKNRLAGTIRSKALARRWNA